MHMPRLSPAVSLWCHASISVESAQDVDANQQGNEFKDVLDKIRQEQKATKQKAQPLDLEEVQIAQQNGSNGVVAKPDGARSQSGTAVCHDVCATAVAFKSPTYNIATSINPCNQ